MNSLLLPLWASRCCCCCWATVPPLPSLCFRFFRRIYQKSVALRAESAPSVRSDQDLLIEWWRSVHVDGNPWSRKYWSTTKSRGHMIWRTWKAAPCQRLLYGFMVHAYASGYATESRRPSWLVLVASSHEAHARERRGVRPGRAADHRAPYV